MIRAYIAGPMRGLPDCNHPAFDSLEDWIDEYGLDHSETDTVWPINPAKNFGGDTTGTYAEYMRADVKQLSECDAIVLLPGWEKSRGASLEIEIARHLELDFYYAYRDLNRGWEILKGAAPQPPALIGEPWIDPEVWEAAKCDRIGGCLKRIGLMTCMCDTPKPVELIEAEAARLVRNGHRQKDYGHPRGDFDTIAALWTPILKVSVTAELVALCMIALKMARLTSNPKHHDSLVDVIGYAICYDRLDEPAA